MARTTLAIDDDLFRRLEERAAQEGRTLQALANDLLRRGLHVHDRPPYRLDLEGWDAQIEPGIDILDRDKLFDHMNGA